MQSSISCFNRQQLACLPNTAQVAGRSRGRLPGHRQHAHRQGDARTVARGGRRLLQRSYPSEGLRRLLGAIYSTNPWFSASASWPPSPLRRSNLRGLNYQATSMARQIYITGAFCIVGIQNTTSKGDMPQSASCSTAPIQTRTDTNHGGMSQSNTSRRREHATINERAAFQSTLTSVVMFSPGDSSSRPQRVANSLADTPAQRAECGGKNTRRCLSLQ